MEPEKKVLEQIESSSEWDKAKISKYVETIGKKLKKIFLLKREGITKDDKAIYTIIEHLKTEHIATAFAETCQKIREKITQLNNIAGFHFTVLLLVCLPLAYFKRKKKIL